MKNLIWLVTLAVFVVPSISYGQSTNTVMKEAENDDAGFPSAIPKGMRAVALTVNSIIGDADSVLPGTRVDIIRKDMPPNSSEGGDSRIILKNIQVLHVEQMDVQIRDGQRKNIRVVTLLVTPEQAQKLTLERGDRIQLAVHK